METDLQAMGQGRKGQSGGTVNEVTLETGQQGVRQGSGGTYTEVTLKTGHQGVRKVQLVRLLWRFAFRE